MDSREYFRGLFGLKQKDDYDKPTKYSTSATPPPPPPAEDVWARDPNDTPKQLFQQRLPAGFDFTDMIHVMEEVFSGIEKSMKDMGPMFQNPTQEFGFSITKIKIDQRLPALPPPTEKADTDLGSLVLNDDDTGRTKQPSHYIPGKTNKKDEDLDELVGSSSFSLGNLPGPPEEDNSGARDCDSQVVPNNQWSMIPGGWGPWSSTVEGTCSLINGKWEGTSVRKTNEGKETITYTRDEKGELVATTEFTPYSQSSVGNPPSTNDFIHASQFPSPGIFGLFNRFFKP